MKTIFETERYILKTKGPKLGVTCFVCKKEDVCLECIRSVRPITFVAPPAETYMVNKLFENQSKWQVDTKSIGNFEKFVFPMIRASYPNLIASDLLDENPFIYLCSDICISMYAMSHMI